MLYKPDWEKTKERFIAFWQGEILDRCCIAVTAPKDNDYRKEYDERYSVDRFSDDDVQSIRAWWCDPEENVKRSEFLFSNTYFGGEALPISSTDWGAMAMCAIYGCEPIFNKTSVWYHKIIDGWENRELNFDKNSNPYWLNLREITAAFASDAPGKYIAGLPQLGTAGDVLSLLRGMDDLCLDLYDHPDELKAAIKTFTKDFLDLQDELYEITSPASYGGGVLPWMNLWMPGKHGNQLACDFSWVISNQSFREFFLQELTEEASWTDYATYHLDGVMCMKNHLDFLLDLDFIKAIQWTPGAGSPPTASPEYIPVYKRILQKGKRLILLAEPQEVELLLEELPPEGLFINTWARDAEEARAMLKMAERKAVQKNAVQT